MRRAERVVPPVVVLALTLLLWRGTLAHLATWSQSPGEDEALFLSWLGHLPWALEHGRSPFVTDVVNAPAGVNALWNTSVVVPALVLAPVTAIGGVVLTYNLAMLAATATTALACVAACRRFVAWWPAALVGGVLAGFSPFALSQARGHLHLTAAAIPPLLLLVGHEALVRQRARPVPLGLLLGLLVVLQFGTSTEVLATSAIVAVPGVGALALLQRQAITRARLRRAAVTVGVGAGVAAALLAYPLWLLLAGPQRLSGPAQSTGSLAADLLSPVIPTTSQRLAPSGLVEQAAGWPGNPVENTAYLGVPLLVVVLGVVVLLRHRPAARWAGTMLLTCFVLSLGRELRVDGEATGIPLPFALVARVPLLESTAAVRFSFYTSLFAGLLVALGADALYAWARQSGHRRRWRIPTLVGAGLGGAAVLLSLLPSAAVTPYRSVPITAPSWFTGDGARRLPAGATVLTYPYPTRADSRPMAWQALARFRFRLVGGYALVPDPSTGRGTFGVATANSFAASRFALGQRLSPGAGRGRAAVDESRAVGVAAVAVVEAEPGADRAVAFWSEALGREPERSGGVAAFYLADAGVTAGRSSSP